MSNKHPIHVHSNENKDHIQIIWFEHSPCPIQMKLLELNPTAQFHTDSNRCIQAIRSIHDEEIFLIIPFTSAENILSETHSYPRLNSVFILSSKIDHGKTEYLNKYSKIVEIYPDYEYLSQAIEQRRNLIEQQILSFDLFDQENDYRNDLSTNSASFLFYQLLIDILKQIPNDQRIRQTLVEKLNDSYRQTIEQYREDYTADQTLQLFNQRPSLRRLINKALKTKDIQMISICRDLIIHLHNCIQLANTKSSDKKPPKVYYGQKIFKNELEKLTQHPRFLVSANAFLCASMNRNHSIQLAKDRIPSDQYQSVLFQIETKSIFPTLRNNDEILFNIDTVFRIHSINYDSSLQLSIIDLVEEDNNYNRVQSYLQTVKQFTREKSFVVFFGHLLTEANRSSQSEIYFQILINCFPSDHEDIASIYNQIGNFSAERGQLKSALDYYQQAYQIREKRLPPNHPHLAESLNNIGLIYKDQGQLDEALDYCQKALAIDEQNYPKDHVSKAMTIENLGGIYKEQQSYSQAQIYFLRALNMYKHVLPSNHHFFPDILNNLGKVYCDQGYFDRALQCYQKALSIIEINHSDDHLQKAQTIENIALLYKTKGLLEKSREELFKALQMYRRIYSTEHADIARCLGHIGLVYEAENQFDLALNYFRQQLQMDEKCLANDHLSIPIDIQWIVDVYKKKEEKSLALDFCQKKFVEKRSLLGEDHRTTLAILRMIIDLCDDPRMKGNYYRQALGIYERLSPSDPYAIIRCLDAMVKLSFQTNAVHEALNYQLKTVDFERKNLGNDHIDLALSLQRLGQLYEVLANVDQAKQCYNESRLILNKCQKSIHQRQPLSTVRKSNVCILQ